MSAPKHTPGPWTACCFERGCFPHVHIGPVDHGRTYASADGGTYEAISRHITINDTTEGAEMAEHKANACLIAAAPDLLEALDDAMPRLESFEGNNDPSSDAVVAKARAALAKARGTP